MTQAEAREELYSMAAADQEPCLTDAELDRCLSNAARATVWVTGTAYTYGQQVIPTVRNGRYYRCVQAGTSSSAEPDWPTVIEGRTGDGVDLVWEEAGSDWDSLWDLQKAAAAAWKLKAGKCAHEFYFAAGGKQFSRQQVIQHCLLMAAQYEPAFIL